MESVMINKIKLQLMVSSLLLMAHFAFAETSTAVKIGLISTLSGPGAALGVDIRDGFQLAVKIADGKLGGINAEIIVADDQASPESGRQAAERMVKQNKIDFMTGIVFSNVLLAVGPPTFQSKTFYISANAGPSQYAGEQCNAYFFSASYQNDNIHEAAGQVVTEKGFKNVAVIAPNYPAGKDAINGFKRFYKGEIASESLPALNQLNFGTEIAQLRASKADAVYIFLPGGMGVNFIKQFVAAGLSKDMTLIGPGFSGDEDVIKAVGDPMLGMFNTTQWAHDMDNAANKKFVSAFEKEYGRLPTLYAAQGYEAAQLIGAAIRDSKGNLDDKTAVRKALMAAKFDSVRGSFKFNTNHFPIQNYYLRIIAKDSKGRITNRLIGGAVLKNHGDVYASTCKMSD